MRTLITAALILTSFFAVANPSGRGKTIPVSVISSKLDIFYFKVDRDFIGASVTVKNEAGETIINSTVMQHKTIIDFYLEAPGDYTIVIEKEGEKLEYVYRKDHAAPTWTEGDEDAGSSK